MRLSVNPFQTLYLTEALEDPELYLRFFSPEILTGEANSLFEIGNIVLKGANGSGKTMLLRLFSPQVHAAFLRSRIPPPLPVRRRKFLAVGVNVIHAGLTALGQRPLTKMPADNVAQWSLIFGDLLNFHIIHEILLSLEFLAREEGRQVREALGARVDKHRLDEFARLLAEQECWFGGLADARDFTTLVAAVSERIWTYRAFVNWNIDRLPEAVLRTKTEIGVPILDCSKGLIRSGIIETSVPVMVTLDQYESLLALDGTAMSDPRASLGRSFCRVVNSLLAMRVPDISYKIAVRPYAWLRELRVFGAESKLELGRDYQVVDLDEILRRKENRAAWIFPKLAADVASRRMKWAFGVGGDEPLELPLQKMLRSLKPEEEVERYCRDDPDRLMPEVEGFPASWAEVLRRTYKENKVQAKYAEVWLRQLAGQGKDLPSPASVRAKEAWRREYWQKERRELLLMHIASQCRQRRLYAGWDTVMTLSGGNILIFLSICREIWDIWTRARAKARRDEASDAIPPEIQSQAIWLVSEKWLDKMKEFPGGDERRKFILRLGGGIRRALLADRALVYPGHTGFSIPLGDYEDEKWRNLREFMDEARDYGDLLGLPHTTKEKDRRPRLKWYLNPILCPHFEIPAERTKEPYYASLDEVNGWLTTQEPIVWRRPHEKKVRGGQHLTAGGQGEMF